LSGHYYRQGVPEERRKVRKNIPKGFIKKDNPKGGGKGKLKTDGKKV
jgi:hypothetical protein